jgi:hypothetical protein
MNLRSLQVVVPWEAVGLATVVGLVRSGQPTLALVLLLTTLNHRCGCAAHQATSKPEKHDAANR